MRHYEHMLQVILDRELADQLDEANRKIGTTCTGTTPISI